MYGEYYTRCLHRFLKDLASHIVVYIKHTLILTLEEKPSSVRTGGKLAGAVSVMDAIGVKCNRGGGRYRWRLLAAGALLHHPGWPLEEGLVGHSCNKQTALIPTKKINGETLNPGGGCSRGRYQGLWQEDGILLRAHGGGQGRWGRDPPFCFPPFFLFRHLHSNRASVRPDKVKLYPLSYL